jgi:hypothetical protein
MIATDLLVIDEQVRFLLRLAQRPGLLQEEFVEKIQGK